MNASPEPKTKGKGRTHKRCPRCERVLPLDAFNMRKGRQLPQSYCRECGKKIGSEWSKANAEHARERNKAWATANAARLREWREAWKNENREKLRESSKRSQLKHREKYVAQRKRREVSEEFRAWRRDYQIQRRANNPTVRLAHNLRSRLYEALKARREPKWGSAVDLLGCSIEEAVQHIERLFKPGMSWANHGEWHFDHIRPLSAFDLSDPQQLAAACHYTNIQPLWAKENQSKGSKIR